MKIKLQLFHTIPATIDFLIVFRNSNILNMCMTNPQFHKFKTNWNVFKRITNILENQLHAQLYSSCDDYNHNSLVNYVTDFFNLTEEQLLSALETTVTKKSNPAVHHL